MNLYTTRSSVKARIDISDTLDDSDIDAALETVCREVDRYCGRHFYVLNGTFYYAASDSGCLRTHDLLSVTSLKTDTAADRTYATTWATTDYELDPPNALTESPPEPYTRIHTTPLGRYGFVCGDRRGNQVVGKRGYYEVLETVSATTAEVLDTTETGIDVTSGAAFNVGDTLLIDAEQVFVTAISTNTLTVTRAVNGTTAAAHITASVIQRYTYPIVGEACAQQAILAFRNSAATFGEIGGNEAFTQSWRQSLQMGLHPFVRAALDSFRRVEVG